MPYEVCSYASASGSVTVAVDVGPIVNVLLDVDERMDWAEISSVRGMGRRFLIERRHNGSSWESAGGAIDSSRYSSELMLTLRSQDMSARTAVRPPTFVSFGALGAGAWTTDFAYDIDNTAATVSRRMADLLFFIVSYSATGTESRMRWATSSDVTPSSEAR